MNPDFYHQRLQAQLLGRRLRESCRPVARRGCPVLEFWGESLGFEESDVHCSQAYRLYLELDEARVITAARVQIDGELLSPCCGYAQEMLDEFDYPRLLRWCEERVVEP